MKYFFYYFSVAKTLTKSSEAFGKRSQENLEVLKRCFIQI